MGDINEDRALLRVLNDKLGLDEAYRRIDDEAKKFDFSVVIKGIGTRHEMEFFRCFRHYDGLNFEELHRVHRDRTPFQDYMADVEKSLRLRGARLVVLLQEGLVKRPEEVESGR